MKLHEYGQKKYTLQQLRELRKKAEENYSALKRISPEDFEAKEEIEKIEDGVERRRLIQENIHLFNK